MEKLNEVVEKVKKVDEGVNNIIVPLLKDTIEDGNRHNKRLFILNVVLAVSVLVISIFSQYLVMIQNEKYADFLSQFEFGEETSIVQDLDTGDNGDIYNPSITNNK